MVTYTVTGAPTLIVAVSVGVFFDKYGDGEM